jgi:hypothetical protein
MKVSSVLFGALGVVGLAGLLSACGSGSPSASASAGGASGSGSASASGTVTGFGSLYINGKKFEANAVFVEQDGESKRCSIGPNDTCGFKNGMQVTANGSFSGSQHTASSVRQKDAVEGLVQSVAPDKSSLVVMGQTVLVDSTTIIDNNIANRDLATLQAGIDHVEVNGHVQPGGIIQATFIERKLANVTPEVRGYVSGHNHSATPKTFKIGHLTVDYTNTPPLGLSDMPSPGPNGDAWNGLFVEVKGGQFTPGPNQQTEGILLAAKVEPENRGVGNDVDEFEVEGFVTNVVSVDINTRVAHFFIGTTEVRTTSNTEFREGTVDEVVPGAKVSAEGRLENGVLIAKHVKFKESARLEGELESVTGSAPVFTVKVKGLAAVTVKTDSQTRVDGSLEAGRQVRVRGRAVGDNTVIATRIQERSNDHDVELRGTVQSINGEVILILGVSVDTGTINHFERVSGTSISRATFLEALKENESLVKVKGAWNGTAVIWDGAELED